MPLQPGERLGPYEILGPIGAGGMGEVYKARDTRLDRTVAIKVLPEHIAQREDLRARFEREARAVASLNHPNICILHDIGNRNGAGYMVMEYLDGETLADRLSNGPLPLAEALRYGADIAHALEQAHRRGIAHRDLKPGNIMLTKTGVKLLDFGLARLREPSPAAGDEHSTLAMTREGLILGTPQYMAPEQVQGTETDARADIFAFASVLYEMIGGRKAFRGGNQPEVMAAILRCEPPPPLATVPDALNRALKICWAKDPDERWQSAGDLRRELAWIAEAAESSAVDSRPARAMERREMLAWATAALACTAAGVALVRNGATSNPAPRRARFGIAPPPGGRMDFFQGFPAVSPDGKAVAFTAGTSATNRSSIWVRALDSPELREIPDTEQATGVFWSPDSRSLGFFARDKLRRVSVAGGSVQAICDSPLGPGGAWNEAGTIVFSRGYKGAIYQVPAAGGTPTPVTSLETERHSAHLFPSWLPGGRQILFTASGSQPERQGVYTASLDSKQITRLLPVMTKARYVSPGYLLSSQDSRMVAQKFDPGRLQLEGDPFTVAEGVWGIQSMGAFDVSDSGVLAFAEADLPSNQLTWFDRAGRTLGTAGAAGPFIHMDLSTDERRVLLERYEGGRGDLWMLDLERNVPTRLTYGPGWAYQAYWSPDGTRVIYSLASEAATVFYLRDAVGTGQEQQLLKLVESGPAAPTDWSRDGRYLVYALPDSKNVRDLWLLPLTPEPAGVDRKPVPYLRSPFLKGQGRVSPDGRWMAYVSTESQTLEVYVSPFPNATAKWRISTAGGVQPCWRADGKELFYLALDRTLMAAPVQGASNFQAGAAVPLFQARPAEYFQGSRNDYAPSRDGQKFLVNTRLGAAGSQGIQVMLGWQPATAR